MNKVGILLILVTFLSLQSCSIFKSTSKHKKIEEVEIIDKSKIETSTEKLASTGSLVDRSITTTYSRKLDSRNLTSQIPASNFMEQIQRGFEIILDSNLLKLKFILDEASNQITIEADITGGEESYTRIENNIQASTNTSREKTKETVQNDSKAIITTNEKLKEAEPKGLFWMWAVIVVIFLILLVSLYMFLKKKFKIF